MGFVRVDFRQFLTQAGRGLRRALCALALLPAAAGAAPYGSNDPAQMPQTAPRQATRHDGERSFTDLYSVTWEEIPLPESTPANPHYITATSITDDGTIAGRGTGSTVLWHPDGQVWEEIPREHNGQPVLVSPDGSSLITTDFVQMPETNILTWNRADGWQVLAGGAVDQSEASSVSRNFRFLVGGGNDNGKVEQAWVWALDGGVQQMLPNPEWSGGAIALAVSDDGNLVVGAAVRAPKPGCIRTSLPFAGTAAVCQPSFSLLTDGNWARQSPAMPIAASFSAAAAGSSRTTANSASMGTWSPYRMPIPIPTVPIPSTMSRQMVR